MGKPREIAIDGETKTISAWAADVRCEVTAGSIRCRLKRKMEPREAVFSTPEYLLRIRFREAMQQHLQCPSCGATVALSGERLLCMECPAASQPIRAITGQTLKTIYDLFPERILK
jgi:hypothetical protein